MRSSGAEHFGQRNVARVVSSPEPIPERNTSDCGPIPRTLHIVAESPFRDPKLADTHRSEREAADARVRAEELAAAEARERAARRKNTQRTATISVLFSLLSVLIGLSRLSVGREEQERALAHARAVASARASTTPKLVIVDPGAVRPSPRAEDETVHRLVDLQVDDLASCFDDGLASGALVMGHGASHAFAFSWNVGPNGTVQEAWAAREPTSNGEPTTETEYCVVRKIREWTFADVRERTQVVAWRFERCPESRDECVRPKN